MDSLIKERHHLHCGGAVCACQSGNAKVAGFVCFPRFRTIVCEGREGVESTIEYEYMEFGWEV